MEYSSSFKYTEKKKKKKKKKKFSVIGVPSIACEPVALSDVGCLLVSIMVRYPLHLVCVPELGSICLTITVVECLLTHTLRITEVPTWNHFDEPCTYEPSCCP